MVRGKEEGWMRGGLGGLYTAEGRVKIRRDSNVTEAVAARDCKATVGSCRQLQGNCCYLTARCTAIQRGKSEPEAAIRGLTTQQPTSSVIVSVIEADVGGLRQMVQSRRYHVKASRADMAS